MEPNELAEALLLKVKKQQDTAPLERELAESISLKGLHTALANDDRRKAFWINIYNAYFQVLRSRDGHVAPAICQEPLVTIAGQPFSLDDIEHGILRRYRWKFSLGFLPNLFTSRLIRRLAVSRMDYRIHFALNCGAVSCPPIAFYQHEKLDAQLDMATRSFMESETIVDEVRGEVRVSRLLLWFLGDFGGFRGIRRLLKEALGLETKGRKIRFRAYDWTEDLANWREPMGAGNS